MKEEGKPVGEVLVPGQDVWGVLLDGGESTEDTAKDVLRLPVGDVDGVGVLAMADVKPIAVPSPDGAVHGEVGQPEVGAQRADGRRGSAVVQQKTPATDNRRLVPHGRTEKWTRGGWKGAHLECVPQDRSF